MNKQLSDHGFTIIRNGVSQNWISKLHSALPDVFDQHRKIKNLMKSDLEGEFAFHLPLSDQLFIDFLQYLIDSDFITDLRTNFFKGPFILNSFTALNNAPGQVSFASNPHRDVRFYTSDVPAMINALIMLTEFSPNTGSTFVLPESHKSSNIPTKEEFFEKAIQVSGVPGDILLFNSNVWHAAGVNSTDAARYGLALTFSIPPLKQLLDYPRALGYSRSDFSDELRTLLGYDARVPASLEEWYLPAEKRLYRKVY